MTDEQSLKQLYREMWHALIYKDISTLEKIHADEFVLVHMTGMHQPKKAYIDAVANNVLNYFSEEEDQIIIDLDRGKMVGQSRVTAAVFGGSTHTWRLQLYFDVKKINGSWKLIHGVASTY